MISIMIMKLVDVARIRLFNQQLVDTSMRNAVEVIEWFGAVQGQEYAQSKWGLGLRLPHLADSDIEKEFTDGKILRTHLLRPTWHLVSAKDIRWLLSLTAPRVHAANKFMYGQSGLDRKIFNRCNKILEKILAGKNYMTREEINEEFRKNKVEANGYRLGYIMMNAELEGVICSGPKRDKKFTYALLEERVKPVDPVSIDEALFRLTRRYFLSRGPATIKDYSTWSGLTVSDCRKGIDLNGQGLNKTDVSGSAYYYFKENIGMELRQNTIHLLPIYDEFIMGYKDRSAYFFESDTKRKKVKNKFDCMILKDGQVIGTWKRTITPKQLELHLQFFHPISKATDANLKKVIKRFMEFNGSGTEKTKMYR